MRQDVREAARAAWFAQRRFRRRLQPAGQQSVCGRAIVRRRCVAEGATGDREQPAACGAHCSRTRQPGRGRGDGRTDRGPSRYEPQDRARVDGMAAELATLALLRLADNDPLAAASQLTERWQAALPKHLAALAWAAAGKDAAQRLLPEAASSTTNALEPCVRRRPAASSNWRRGPTTRSVGRCVLHCASMGPPMNAGPWLSVRWILDRGRAEGAGLGVLARACAAGTGQGGR